MQITKKGDKPNPPQQPVDVSKITVKKKRYDTLRTTGGVWLEIYEKVNIKQNE